MWRTEKPSLKDFGDGNGDGSSDRNQGTFTIAQSDTTGAQAFVRANPSAQHILDELRAQPGFGVVVKATDMQPMLLSASDPARQSIGNRLTADIEAAIKRAVQLGEVRALAQSRVFDLTPEQLQRILSEVRS